MGRRHQRHTTDIDREGALNLVQGFGGILLLTESPLNPTGGNSGARKGCSDVSFLLRIGLFTNSITSLLSHLYDLGAALPA